MAHDASQAVSVTAPLEVVGRRLPSEVIAGGATLILSPDARRRTPDGAVLCIEGVWRAPAADGTALVQICAGSTRTSQIEVAVDAPQRRLRAHRWTTRRRVHLALDFATALQRHVEQRGAPRVPGRAAATARRIVRIGAPVAGIALLATIALVATLLSPPNPVTVDTATQRYRQEAAAQRATDAERPVTRRNRTSTSGRATSTAPSPRRQRRNRSAAASTTVAATAATPTRRGNNTAQADVQRRSDTRTPDSATGQRRPATQQVVATPPQGVYRYDTKGWEEVDAPGGHREFPRETTQTVVHTRCGHRVRWDPMEERWDENHLCVRDGRSQPVSFQTYRSFFGREYEQEFTCRPAQAPDGALWAAKCRSEDTALSIVARELGTKTLRVEGRPVEVEGLDVQSTLDGATTGTRDQQMWHARSNGILVHTEVSADLTTEGPFGRMAYQERYTLHLASTKAHR